jgi:hypothetical protein
MIFENERPARAIPRLTRIYKDFLPFRSHTPLARFLFIQLQ